jgi:hypothetical protein
LLFQLFCIFGINGDLRLRSAASIILNNAQGSNVVRHGLGDGGVRRVLAHTQSHFLSPFREVSRKDDLIVIFYSNHQYIIENKDVKY